MSDFIQRHIGPSDQDISAMLKTIGHSDLESFIADTLPDSILTHCQNKIEFLNPILEVVITIQSPLLQFLEMYFKTQVGIQPTLLIKLKFLKAG